MQTDRLPLAITSPASPQHAAAIVAAISAYLDAQTTSTHSPTPATNPWRMAGRLEGQRLPITPATLTGRWRF